MVVVVWVPLLQLLKKEKGRGGRGAVVKEASKRKDVFLRGMAFSVEWYLKKEGEDKEEECVKRV